MFRLFAGRVAFRSWGDGAENHEQLEIEPGRRFSARRPVRSRIGLATARRPPRSPPATVRPAARSPPLRFVQGTADPQSAATAPQSYGRGTSASSERGSIWRSIPCSGLIRRNCFPVVVNCFPVLSRRELNLQTALADVLETDFGRKRLNRRNSLFFPVSRDLGSSEDSSQKSNLRDLDVRLKHLFRTVP